MKLRLSGMLVLGTLVLAACAGTIPESGLNATSQASNFKYSTPQYFTASVGDRVFFALDKSTLSPAAMTVLDAQAVWLNENPNFKPLIEGNTDERGTQEYNLALGARRASAVKEYLVSKGVVASRLSTVSYGKERPVALCSNESCWSQNRRAVTAVTAGGNS